MEHIEHGRIGGIVGLVKAQADFPVNLPDFQPVDIFQRKERVHKPDIGINIRYGEGVGAYIKDTRHFFYKVMLRCPRFSFILCHADIRGLSEKAEDFAQLFLCHALSVAEKRIRLPIVIIKPPL